MRYIISAGGTGGHIYPALAIITKIKEEDKEAKILYIGTKDRMESKIIPEKGIPYFGIKLSGLNRKNILKNVAVLNDLKESYKQVKSEIKKFDPDIVIGVGGYVTFPVIKAAHKLGYKTVIHEQNSIPGLTNKMLSKIVDKIFISLPGSRSYFKNNRVIYTGNPRSQEVLKVSKILKEDYGLSNQKKLVIIVMGSLGSMTINNKLTEIIPKFEDKSYEVVFITGKDYYDNYKNLKMNNVKIYPFLDNLLAFIKASDLVISRSGASIISELTVSKVPSILVPSPYVTNNHQYKNALELVDVGASVMLEEKDFNSENLFREIDNIFSNDIKYNEMVNANKKLAVNNSQDVIYREIIKVIKEKEDEKNN